MCFGLHVESVSVYVYLPTCQMLEGRCAYVPLVAGQSSPGWVPWSENPPCSGPWQLMCQIKECHCAGRSRSSLLDSSTRTPYGCSPSGWKYKNGWHVFFWTVSLNSTLQYQPLLNGWYIVMKRLTFQWGKLKPRIWARSLTRGKKKHMDRREYLFSKTFNLWLVLMSN